MKMRLGGAKNPSFISAIRLAMTLATTAGSPSWAASDATVDPHPLRTADTPSPQSTLTSFLETLNEMNRPFRTEGRVLRSDSERRGIASRALRCLDLREVPASIRTSTAREAGVLLKEVLDRIELPPEEGWPDAERVSEDGLSRWTIRDHGPIRGGPDSLRHSGYEGRGGRAR